MHVGAGLSLAQPVQVLNSINSAGDDPAGLDTTDLVVGANSLTIVNGGQVCDGNGFIGENGQIGFNTALITGAASVWNNSGDLMVGAAGVSNQLTIADAGEVMNVNGTIGGGSTAISNAVVVSGSGALWLNAGDLHICTDDAVLQQANTNILQANLGVPKLRMSSLSTYASDNP